LTNLEADQSKIFVSTDEIILDGDGFKAIESMIDEVNAKLVIIDPIVAYLGPKVDMNRANEVRHIMKGLSRVARTKNISIIVVRHNRKQTDSKAIYAGMGSIDFTASVRSELAVTETKSGTKFMNHIKANSGNKGKSITYEIRHLHDGSAKFCWGDFANTQWSPTGEKAGISRKFKKEGSIKQWLFDILKDCPDGMSVKQILTVGQALGYSQTKLEHVKKGVAISEKRKDGWYWRLDTSAPIAGADKDEVD
jgi:hypothetical protein